jgi:hypothetical protein
MRRYIPHTVISGAALLIALGHMVFPSVKVDAVTLALILIAVLPWLGSVFKSVELPGGIKVEYRALEKAAQDADKVGLLAAPRLEIAKPSYIAVMDEDPNLGLAGLRIEIERRLRAIAASQGLNVGRSGIGQLMRLLRTNGAISQEEESVLSDLTGLLNGAVHGAEVDNRAVRWAMDVGPRLLAALDERASRTADS